MTSRRAAALAASLGLLGGGALTVGPALADSPATVDDTAPDTADDGAGTTAAEETPTSAGETLTEDEEAADSSTATDEQTDDQETDDVGTERRSWIDDVLSPLVEAGTITQEQADAVAAALQDSLPIRDAGRNGGRFDGVSVRLETLTETLGVTAGELASAFAEGQSIADIAEAQGVDVQTVIDALVAATSERIDEAVADGRLTEDEAATRLATATERITELVNQPGGPALPHRPSAPSGPGGGFPGGGQLGHDDWPMPPAAPDAPAAPSDVGPSESGTAAPDTASDSTADA